MEFSPSTAKACFLGTARSDWVALLPWQADGLPRVRQFADLHASKGYAFGHSFQAMWQICHQMRSAM
jgi:hypothetical protein